ncbi:endonuclease MutS2 [Bacillaceae bacterium S4-13-56]
MNSRIYSVLEYDKILEKLQNHATSSLGKKEAKRLKPSTKVEEVIQWQEETDEGTQVLRIKGNVPLGGVFDIRPYIKRASIGGILSTSELVEIGSTLYASRQMKNFLEGIEEDELTLPHLREISEQINVLSNLEHQIKSCIDDHGHVMDGASDSLRTIRTKMRTLEGRIREKLVGYTRSHAKMLSDSIVTIRNERYVLPVKQEYRANFGGIVHDQSSSGATLYIEPQVIVDLNNQLQESKSQEKNEVERILRELSGFVATDSDFLSENVKQLTLLDFIFAKARFSREIRGAMPKINGSGQLKMLQARHPLIPIDEVVPNDIELGYDFTSIVITGPNTGGKTVTLKLIGLCTLMAQSGLQVPALDGCEMPVFENVFADIGDEQSIEQSLSTFSSHMTNIVEILKHVNHQTLALFDELGAGTDPQEGAALAMSILDEVVRKGARVVATTHYPELKAYGYNREGVVNASVEFDVSTLSPTYRLLIGVPGRSNAFEISKRLGLEEDIINKARGLTGTDSQSVENMIASLEQSTRQAEKDYEEAERVLKEAEQLRKEIQKNYLELEKRKEDLYRKAEEKAKKAIDQAREEAETIVAELREMKSNASLKEHEWIEARKQFDEAQPHLAQNKDEQVVKNHPPKALDVGDEVRVLSLGQQGTITDKISEKEYQVQIGMMKVKVKTKDLQQVKKEKPQETRPVASVKGSQHHVKPELDLRGERFEDAILELEKYVDDALLAGYPQVSIIHGKGTGALRKGVQEFAKKHRAIASTRLGSMNEGGSGVTIFELK